MAAQQAGQVSQVELEAQQQEQREPQNLQVETDTRTAEPAMLAVGLPLARMEPGRLAAKVVRTLEARQRPAAVVVVLTAVRPAAMLPVLRQERRELEPIAAALVVLVQIQQRPQTARMEANGRHMELAVVAEILNATGQELAPEVMEDSTAAAAAAAAAILRRQIKVEPALKDSLWLSIHDEVRT